MHKSNLYYGNISCISIQLLFRWNYKRVWRRHSRALISIQLLFRWNSVGTISLIVYVGNFNTTIVSVECLTFYYSSNYNYISIQLLFRWNYNWQKKIRRYFIFQYNYCFGGIRFQSALYNINNRFQYNYCFGGIH